MEDSFISSSQYSSQHYEQEYSEKEREQRGDKHFRLNSKFMFITWENVQCNLEFIFSKLLQKVMTKEQEFGNDESTSIKKSESEFELEVESQFESAEQLSFEQGIMIEEEEESPKCEYFIICKKDCSPFSYQQKASSSTFYGFFYWSKRKSIRDCRKFFRVQGVDSRNIKCDKSRVSDPQNCVDFIRSQKLRMEYGTQPQEKSNKGGRPPSKQQQQFLTSNELMQIGEEEAWNLKPNLTYQYQRLKKSYRQLKALKDPEEKKEFQHRKLYQWQQELLEELLYEKPPERLIVWYHDSIGNSGKSSFANHLADNYPSKCLLLDVARKPDMSFLVKPQHEWIIIDVCRAYQHNKRDIKQLCMFAEKLKDTRVMNSKYQSEMVKLNKTPHVIVMANFMPNLDILSRDRWNIRDLGLLNIPRRNEVKSYNGALKFENLIKEAQRQMQVQQQKQTIVATASANIQQQQQQLQYQHTIQLKFEGEQTKRQNNNSNIFASTSTTQQQKQKPMLQQYDELPSQKQEIKRLESSSQEMDFEEEEGEENSTSFRYDYQ